MTQEDVIKGLECCFDALVQEEHALAENGIVMSSWQDRAKRIDAIREAIAFLKAQEPMRPIPGLWDRDIQLFNCGACGGEIGAGGIAKYCFHCGRAVKWDA